MKICTRCLVEKPLNMFHRGKNYKDGHQYHCKQCAREYVTQNRHIVSGGMLKRRYGIDYDDYELMLKQQNGVCAICGKVDPYKRALAVDHDHSTKKVRGLLCNPCNTSLGKMHDDPALLRRAAEYLEESSKS